MKTSAPLVLLGGCVFAGLAGLAACSSDSPSPGPAATGGSVASGGKGGASGGSSGGAVTQAGAGGTVTTGGAASGGASGASAGGGGRGGAGGSATTGGATATGGASTGGSGGSAAGGAGTGGTITTGGGGAGGSSGGTGGTAGGSVGTGGVSGGTSGWHCPDASTLTGSPIPSGAKPTRIAGAPPTDSFNMNNFTNVEGPVWIGDSLYFGEYKTTDIPPARIFRIGPGDAVSLFVDDSGSNGLAIDHNGNLATANHGIGGIVSYNLSDKKPTTLIGMYMNKRFNSPNDLAFKSDGTLFFSDPSYQNNARPQNSTFVYQVPLGSTTATPVTDYTSNPNGITLSLDEKSLFVSGGSGLKKYAIDSSGAVLMTGTAFGGSATSGNTDGMVVDCAGNLYVTVASSTNVVVLDPSGNPVPNSPITISSDGPSGVTNLAFGGPDRKTLYITGQGSSGQQGVFKVNLNFPGLPY